MMPSSPRVAVHDIRPFPYPGGGDLLNPSATVRIGSVDVNPRNWSRSWAPALVLMIGLAACGDDDNGTTSSANGATTTTAPPLAIDLQPVDMRFELSGQPDPLTHTFVFEMRNNEPGTASDFDVDCTYDNAGSTGGVDAVSSGVLNGNSSFTYTQLTAIQGPTPSSALVECVVDPDNDVAETREDNNMIAFTVSIP